MTIYKRAVQQIAPQVEEQIDQFICDARTNINGNGDKSLPQVGMAQCKDSSASEELMDTNDENDLNPKI